jgi:ADP-heptose:LPS heptosyltransferase
MEGYDVVLWPECKPNWPCKRWPYFKELASYFDDIVIIGTEPDNNFPNATDYRGRLTLLQTGGIIKNARIFIGNEGGMVHYAAALGIKTYVIMGATDPVKCLPPGNTIDISLHLKCQPCQFRTMMVTETTAIGCHEKSCLNDLTAKKVMEYIK